MLKQMTKIKIKMERTIGRKSINLLISTYYYFYLPIRYVRVLAFYNKHFPTDKKTYSIRLPLIGLVSIPYPLNLYTRFKIRIYNSISKVFSILCLHIVVTFWGRNAYEGNQLVILSYILLSTGVAYELYWGFNVVSMSS